MDLHERPVYIDKEFGRMPSDDTMISKYQVDPLELLGERSFNEPQVIDESKIGSPVQEFFRDAVVFVTGATGFMGKVLIEKLLRTCPNIKHIYVLIRNKKGKNALQRLDDIFDDRLFKRLKHEVPKYYNKVSAISGDCSLPGLGLSENSRKTLIDEVNMIFHGAATVRFNEHIRVAMTINVSGTREVLKLAREIINLKVVAHISTAYANCNQSCIEEKFYKPKADYEELLKLISSKDDQTLQDMTNEIIGDLPNTYSFTKSLAEDVVQREGKDLPILVLRPTVIVATYREPVRSWIDNLYGPTGIIIGASTGVLHTYYLDTNIVTDLIPIDMVVNTLICAAKETATNKKIDEIPIYTCSSSRQKPIRWCDFIEMNVRHGAPWPSIQSIWFYSFWPTKNPYIYAFLNFFCHKIFGYLLDTLAVMLGKKPMLVKTYKRINQLSNILAYFSDRQWTFINDNVLALWNTLDSQDKILFNFDINQLSWEHFSQAHALGLRVYLQKEDIRTLPLSRKKQKILYAVHRVFLLIVYAFLICFVIFMINLLLRVTAYTPTHRLEF